jgi:hypothetical protein
LYNLANLMRLRGDCREMQRLLELAYEDDTSVYRVKRAYRAVIAEFNGCSGVEVLDLKPILQPHQFVDYCHPSEEGHETIADALAVFIGKGRTVVPRSHNSRYELALPSPNYVNSPTDTFIDYYCIDWRIESDRIAKVLAAMLDGKDSIRNEDQEIGKCLENFLLVNRCHPIFTDNLELHGALTPRSHEILSFPEFFSYRILYNYVRAFEQGSLGDRLSCGALLDKIRLTAADYQRMILRVNNDPLDLELDVRREYYDVILARVRQQLASSDRIYRVCIGERVRTTMTWYTREALRFGTQSRTSMLYARCEIERLVEGLVVAVVIACARNEPQELATLDRMLAGVMSLLEIHEHHAGLYNRDFPAFSAAVYRADLAGVEKSIKAPLAV